MRVSRRRTAAVLVAIFGLASCGGSGDGDSSGAVSDPLAEFMGWDVNASDTDYAAQELEVQELISTCMRAEGFDYEPFVYPNQTPPGAEEDAALSADPEAYGEKYGYGIVHNYEIWEEPYLDEDGNGGGFGPGTDVVDPNNEYMMSLSPAEQEDYSIVLWGDQSYYEEQVPDEDGVFEPPPLETQGCYGQAQAEVYGQDPFQMDPEIQTRLNDFFENMMNGAEMEAANEQWLECITDELGSLDEVEGFTAETPNAMYQYMDGLKQLAQGKEIVPIDPETGEPIGDYDTSMGYSSTQNEDGTGFAYIGENVPIPEDELEALRTRELEVYKADKKCQDDADILGLMQRAQQRLVDELRAEFPELDKSGDQ